MTNDLFSAPATATGLNLKALTGSLLLVTVNEVATGINTSFGLTDAIRANVEVLDGDHAGELYDDTLIFPKVLQSQLRTKVGGRVLARLGQGTAKPGQEAPWVLNAATEADVAAATAHLTRTSTPAVMPAQGVPQATAAPF